MVCLSLNALKEILEEDDDHDEGRSWLKELENAQAGNYPSSQRSL